MTNGNPTDSNTPKVVIEVTGGLVSGVYSDCAIEIVVVDWDNIRVGDEPPEAMQLSDGTSVSDFMTAATAIEIN